MRKLNGFVLLAALVFAIGVLFAGCGPSEFTLTTNADPTAGGNITPSGGSYSKGVLVNVAAKANSGYRFDHWEGGASGNSPAVQITMDSNKELTAYFTKTYSLSATAFPNGGGNISPSSGTYDAGKQVTLIATPAQYYKFNGWSGDVSGNSDHLTITVDSSKQVIASFVKLTTTLQSQVDPPGGGTIDPSVGTFEAGLQVKVTATPSKGYRFDHWGGAVTGTANPTDILMNSDKTVAAYFIKQ